MSIQKHNIINISIVAAVIIFIVFISVFVSNSVPPHHTTRAQIFLIIGMLIFFATLTLFVSNFRLYLLFIFVIISLLPYFETYLTPLLRNDYFRISPQLFLILLALVGYSMRPMREQSVLIEIIFFLWIVINFASILLNKCTLYNIPAYLAGVVGPSLFTIIICRIFLNDKKGFTILLNTFWVSMSIYLFFSIFTLLIVAPLTTVQDLYLSRFGGEFARGPYGSNALPFYMSLVMPLYIYALFSNAKPLYSPKLFHAVLIVLVILMSFLIISRGAIIVSIAYVFLGVWLFIYNRMINGQKKGVGEVLILATIAIFLLLPVITDDYWDLVIDRFGLEKKIGFTELTEAYNLNLRTDLRKYGIEIFKQNMALGVGLGNIRTEMIQLSSYDFDSHNLLLDIFAEQGVFAGLIILFIVGISIKRAIQLYKYKKPFAGVNMSLCLGIMIFFVYGSLLTGGRLISTGVTISGFGAYFLFMSFVLQDYIWRSRNDASNSY